MAIGDFTPLVLKPELEQVETRTTQAEDDVGSLDTQLNNPTTGIAKQLLDIDNDINEADVGIKARIADLEQGGTSTTKFRQHSQNGVYEDGEAVEKDGVIYKANSDIDGSSTPVPLVTGTGVNTWTALDGKAYKTTSYYQQDNNSSTNFITPATDGLLLVSQAKTSDRLMGIAIDSTRGRVSLEHSGSAEKAILENSDFTTKGDNDSLYIKNPVEADTEDLGSINNFFKDAYVNKVNFSKGSNVEGYIECATNQFNIRGNNYLSLGRQGVEYMRMIGRGTEVKKDLIINEGNSLKFEDSDGLGGQEGIDLKMTGNQLGFYGVLNGSIDTDPSITINYDGKATFVTETTFNGEAVFNDNAKINSRIEMLGAEDSSKGMRWYQTTTLKADFFRRADSNARIYMTNNGSSNLTGAYLSKGGTTWTSTSDRRLKKNIEPINKGLDAINKLNPVQYEWKETESSDKVDYGFIAQEVIDVLPHAVIVGNDGDDGSGDVVKSGTGDKSDAPDPWGVNYTEIIAPLVKAVQELSAKCDGLQNEINTLKSKLG